MKRKNLICIVTIFVAFIVFSQFSFAQMGTNMGMNKHHKDFSPRMMLDKLNLTEDQQAAVEKLHFNHQNEMIDLRANLEKKKLELKELKMNGNYSRSDFINKVKAINDVKSQIAIAKANHHMDIYELLTDEQKKMFNDEMDDFRGPRDNMKERPMMRNRF